jgi:drug/metabolite transporter (DMT)-like permease
MSNNLKGGLLLTLAALLWGTTFVAQEEATRFIDPFTLNCLRSFVAVAVLTPLVFFLKAKREKTNGKEKLFSKKLILGGLCCGTALAVASNLQQFGILFNSSLSEGDSGKAGFITAMYIIFVPLITGITGNRVKFSCLIAVIIGVAGLYFISVKEGFTVASGDIVLLLCALAFSVHIIVVDRFGSALDAIKLSTVQFFFAGLISLILSLIFERDTATVSNIMNAVLPILYCGILSSSIAFTLQVVAQKMCEPTIASLVMSLESVFCMLAACCFYTKLPLPREIIGCVLMLIAIFIVQTPFADKLFEKITERFRKHERV